MFLRRASSAHGTCSRAILASLLILLFTLALLLAGCGGSSTTTTSSPTPPGTPAPPSGGGNGGGGSGSGGGSSGGGSGSGGGGNGGSTASDQTLKTEDVATGLDNPWSLVFAPDGRLFFTEPPGRLRNTPALPEIRGTIASSERIPDSAADQKRGECRLRVVLTSSRQKRKLA